ncbi:flagellar export chaperone FlgN [Salidesulfovibrio onnuriiensis]|uniref:flagellar export chaperone FlgN n=1 Tax=Salidesulfovibrio onnuriiensis TaxID=2583823 RepID=UPI0011CC1F91|nr:flagellar export chaperone FlgN [Salidesulfovibrio onnuriiensis]
MIRVVEENLVRQNKGMILLKLLLEEEFARLMNRDPQGVSQIELSIQELLRQLSVERRSVKRLLERIDPTVSRVRDLRPSLDEEEAKVMDELLEMLDKSEQQCAVQASKNHELAMALQEQSKSLLDFMHREIQPKNNNAYSAKGRFAVNSNGQANILRGRL